MHIVTVRTDIAGDEKLFLDAIEIKDIDTFSIKREKGKPARLNIKLDVILGEIEECSP